MLHYVTSLLHISLIDYRDIEPDLIVDTINNLPDPGSSSLNLRCRKSGLALNYIVETSANHPHAHYEIVDAIEMSLDRIAAGRRSKDP